MGGKDAPGLEVFGEGEPRFQAGGLAGSRHREVRDAHVFDVHAHAVADHPHRGTGSGGGEMSREKLIYIASPYAGDIETNTAFAKKACWPSLE